MPFRTREAQPDGSGMQRLLQAISRQPTFRHTKKLKSNSSHPESERSVTKPGPGDPLTSTKRTWRSRMSKLRISLKHDESALLAELAEASHWKDYVVDERIPAQQLSSQSHNEQLPCTTDDAKQSSDTRSFDEVEPLTKRIKSIHFPEDKHSSMYSTSETATSPPLSPRTPPVPSVYSPSRSTTFCEYPFRRDSTVSSRSTLSRATTLISLSAEPAIDPEQLRKKRNRASVDSPTGAEYPPIPRLRTMNTNCSLPDLAGSKARGARHSDRRTCSPPLHPGTFRTNSMRVQAHLNSSLRGIRDPERELPETNEVDVEYDSEVSSRSTLSKRTAGEDGAGVNVISSGLEYLSVNENQTSMDLKRSKSNSTAAWVRNSLLTRPGRGRLNDLMQAHATKSTGYEENGAIPRSSPDAELMQQVQEPLLSVNSDILDFATGSELRDTIETGFAAQETLEPYEVKQPQPILELNTNPAVVMLGNEPELTSNSVSRQAVSHVNSKEVSSPAEPYEDVTQKSNVYLKAGAMSLRVEIPMDSGMSGSGKSELSSSTMSDESTSDCSFNGNNDDDQWIESYLRSLQKGIVLRLMNQANQIFASHDGTRLCAEGQPTNNSPGNTSPSFNGQPQISRSSSRSGLSGKRPLNSGNGPEDDDDEQEDGRNKRPRSDTLSPLEGQREYACPYLKRNPEKHQDRKGCKSGFRDTHRVKEHVKRAHKLILCARCKLDFEDPQARDAHAVSSVPCQPNEDDFDRSRGFSETEQANFKSRAGLKGLSEPDR
ncbi:hypothetical protein BT63DRAFT_458101 [Microthyrium microscopicum]|uniref:C2H2-type domain-containing protein n=1 Tax=Microthyrium microscopicum TaxID=703497 RepID=A0A6A6U5F4_9PEZI|nr:hypothetical protein BT63DRAFT_458101 [Microthyrium microscopicum]